MSVGKTLEEMTGDLDDVLGALPATKPREKAKTAPGQLMQFSAELQVYQDKIAELERLLAAGTILRLDVDLIDQNPWQPRKEFDEVELTELAESIRDVGLIQPIIVRRAPDGVRYQLVAGERRLRSHKMLGLQTIAAVIMEAPDQDMFVLALTENIGRANLSHYEICKSIVAGEDQFRNRKVMSSSLGMSRRRFYHYLEFQKLPDFIIEDLELKPRLLGADAAVALVSVLSKLGEPGLPLMRELWGDFKAGNIDQTKLASTLERVATKTETSNTGRELHKFWVGKEQAATITKDEQSFAIKVKSRLLTPEKEKQLRDLMGLLFAEQPGR